MTAISIAMTAIVIHSATARFMSMLTDKNLQSRCCLALRELRISWHLTRIPFLNDISEFSDRLNRQWL